MLSAKGGFSMEEAAICKNIFQDKSGTPNRDTYTRIWLELVRRAAKQELYEKVQVPDGNE